MTTRRTSKIEKQSRTAFFTPGGNHIFVERLRKLYLFCDRMRAFGAKYREPALRALTDK